MNKRQKIYFEFYFQMQCFFLGFKTRLVAALPSMQATIDEYVVLYKELCSFVWHQYELKPSVTYAKKSLRAAISHTVWRLTSAIQCYYELTNNTAGTANVKMSKSGLKRLGEDEFYTFSQMIVNLYQPAICTPYEITQSEVDILKANLLNFPNIVKTPNERRLARHESYLDIETSILKIRTFLKKNVARKMELVKMNESDGYDIYKLVYKAGFIGITRGKPHKEGIIKGGEIIVLSKHEFRNQRILYIRNLGQQDLLGGIGLTEKAMFGTPFIIPAGKSKQRISHKMAAEGEYFLLQNTSDEDLKYKVWMKE